MHDHKAELAWLDAIVDGINLDIEQFGFCPVTREGVVSMLSRKTDFVSDHADRIPALVEALKGFGGGFIPNTEVRKFLRIPGDPRRNQMAVKNTLKKAAVALAGLGWLRSQAPVYIEGLQRRGFEKPSPEGIRRAIRCIDGELRFYSRETRQVGDKIVYVGD